VKKIEKEAQKAIDQGLGITGKYSNVMAGAAKFGREKGEDASSGRK